MAQLTMHDLILHQYDFSPFSEKIRLVFGLKSLPWRSVTIPSVMPKPDLVALTGGYRHTPVLQIGADIYCDTRLIARELDRRYPQQPLIDRHLMGLTAAIEAWAEGDLFWPLARYVSGINAEEVGDALHADRAALRGKLPPTVERLKAVAERSFGQMQAQIPRIENMLVHGRPYLLSDRPKLADFAVYHALWFLKAMPVDCSAVLDPFPKIRTWMTLVQSIGHSTSQEMSSGEAIEVAKSANPASLEASSPASFDPPLGSRVALRPEGYATEDVVGDLAFADCEEIAVHRAGSAVGDVVVHFPRIGYSMSRL